MSDGSTDRSAVEQEIVYEHFASKGLVHCNFLGLMECEIPNAEGIYKVVLEATKFPNISRTDILQKMVAFAGDGASVTTGEKIVLLLFLGRESILALSWSAVCPIG